MFVRTVSLAADGAPTPPISIRYPPQPQLQSFDAFGEHLYLGERAATEEQWWSRFSTLSYARPDETLGAATIGAINRWIDHGLALTGGKDGLGFLFFYELMSGSLSLKILSSDSPYILGALLLRMLPPRISSARTSSCPSCACSRTIAPCRGHAALPGYAQVQDLEQGPQVVRDAQEPLASIRDFAEASGVRSLAAAALPYKAAALLQAPPMAELLASNRRWLSAHVFDSANEREPSGPSASARAPSRRRTSTRSPAARRPHTLCGDQAEAAARCGGPGVGESAAECGEPRCGW